jgi:hypothetical protein
MGGLMSGMSGMGGSIGSQDHDSPRPGRPGENLDPNSFSLAGKVEEGICKNCTILRATAQLTNEAGKGVSIGSGLYLHHIVMVSRVATHRVPEHLADALKSLAPNQRTM